MNKTIKEVLSFRIDAKDRQSLEKDAESLRVPVTSYIRMLLYTHPDRPHNQKKGK